MHLLRLHTEQNINKICSNCSSKIKTALKYGLNLDRDLKIDTKNVMPHLREVVESIYNGHHPDTLEKDGIKVFHANPRFLDKHTLELNGKKITSKYFIITSGSRALIPQISGLESIKYLTNETVFKLNHLPESLIVLGARPIGVETSQSFNRLGVKVTLIEMLDNILPLEYKELTSMLAEILINEGLEIKTSRKAVQLERNGNQATVYLKIATENKHR